jgi:NAD-dependent SIR2 family protein deacetylase
MNRTVVFLGAGSSKALGLPITSDIFPMLIERLMSQPPSDAPLFGGDAIDRHCLKRCLDAILPGLTDLAASLPNREAWRETFPPITDVLSTVDYSLLSASAPSPDFTLSELARGRMLLERAVFELLVRNESPDALHMEGMPETVADEWRQTGELQLLPQRPHKYLLERQRVVDWLMELAPTSKDHVTLISTNYDIEVEQELYTRLGYDVFDRVDFGMRVREPDKGTVYRRPDHARFGVYKLHGSLNWLRCDLCGNVYLNPVGAIAYLSFLLGDTADRHKQENPWLEQLEARGANMCHCGYRPLRHVIVAPSFVCDVRDPMLLEIWRNALEALRQADKWIIVGYSLPPEDVAIRSMFLRAYQGRDSAARPQVVVVQKEKKEPELTRYRLLFPKHSYVAGGLSGYLDSGNRRST